MAVQAQMYADNPGLPFCGSLDFCCNPQEAQQLQQPQQFYVTQQLQSLNQKNQSLGMENDFVFSAGDSKISTVFSESLVAMAEKQRQEIEAYINLQSERLRLVLQDQRKRQFAAVIGRAEARAAMVMRQKDEEIAQAAKRTMELQQFMKRVVMENEAWRRLAGENEATIVNLNATIEQLRAKAANCVPNQQISNGDVEDAESCCEVKSEEDDDDDDVEETGTETGERNSKRRKTTTMMNCRNCNSGKSSVLFLPCRHLCCCTACEAFLHACPVCKSEKKGSIEALVF